MITQHSQQLNFFSRIQMFVQKRGIAHACAELAAYAYYSFIGIVLRKPVAYLQKGVVKKLFNFTPYDFWKSFSQYPKQQAAIAYNSLPAKPQLFLIVTTDTILPERAQFISGLLQQEVYANWMLVVKDTIAPLFSVSSTQLLPLSNQTNSLLAAIEDEKPGALIFIDPYAQPITNSLLHIAEYTVRFPGVDMMYADEEIDVQGNIIAFPKPEYGPHTILGQYLIGGLCIIRPSFLLQHDLSKWNTIDDIVLAAIHLTTKIKRIPIPLSRRKELTEEELLQWQTRVMAQQKIKGIMVRDTLTNRWKPSLLIPAIHPLVSIIIPTKNNIDILKQCLDSIYTKTSYSNFEIIILDNNSDDQHFFSEIKRLEHLHKNLRCIAVSIPFNFSTLMNVGAQASSGEYLVLLNNDVEIISPEWLSDMIGMAQVNQTGVVGAKLLYPDETIQHAGIAIHKGDTFAHHVFAHKPRYDLALCNSIQSIRNYSALTAACILVSKKIYEEAGGFDEQFAVEYNDVDFCLRVQQLGYHNVYLPYVELFHYESISRGHPHSGKKALERSRTETALFYKKWNTIIDDDPNWHPALSFIPQLAD